MNIDRHKSYLNKERPLTAALCPCIAVRRNLNHLTQKQVSEAIKKAILRGVYQQSSLDIFTEPALDFDK